MPLFKSGHGRHRAISVELEMKGKLKAELLLHRADTIVESAWKWHGEGSGQGYLSVLHNMVLAGQPDFFRGTTKASQQIPYSQIKNGGTTQPPRRVVATPPAPATPNHHPTPQACAPSAPAGARRTAKTEPGGLAIRGDADDGSKHRERKRTKRRPQKISLSEFIARTDWKDASPTNAHTAATEDG